MYIEPNTDIWLMSGVPLGPDQNNTIYFDTEEQQISYFEGYVTHRFSAQSYARVNRGVLKLKVKPDSIYGCNYLMFRNSSFGPKWFYAFIIQSEYINNVTTEIRFVVDDLQTWHFNYELEQSFVVREHSATDVIGENTFPEGLETGPYVMTKENIYNLEPNNIYVNCTNIPPWGGEIPPVSFRPPFYNANFKWSNPCYSVALPISEVGIDALKRIIDAINSASVGYETLDKPEIVEIFESRTAGIYNDFRVPPMTTQYTPRNKKLLSYPYVFCQVYGTGSPVELRYELLNNNVLTVVVPYGSNPTFLCVPNYAGINTNPAYATYASGVPLLSWKNDSYNQWVAVNGPNALNRTIASGINTFTTSAINAGLNAPKGTEENPGPNPVTYGLKQGAVSSAVNVLGNAVNYLSEKTIAQRIPDTVSGNLAAAQAIMGLNGEFGFHACCMSIRAEYAKKIDSFFDRFGYATNTTKIPNRNVRPCWTYTKTVGCTLSGDLPSDAHDRISAIYDKGITFWKPNCKLGDYSQNNAV